MVLMDLVILLIGLGVVIYSSNRSVVCATHVANKFKVPPLIIGVVLISFGTDIPEIANSIFSSYSGHGDINVGNIFGSSLSQITLVLGLAVLLGGVLKTHRRNVLILGSCAAAAVALAAAAVSDGELSRLDGGMLILSYMALLAISAKFTIREFGTKKEVDLSCLNGTMSGSLVRLGAYLALVVIGAIVVVESAVRISLELGFPEYFISFFIIGIGTSLPEFSVELSALRKKKYGLVLGDMMGSNITDATLALGIGPLLFPTGVSSSIVFPLAIYVVLASVAVVTVIAWRKKVDRWAALLFLSIYALSLAFV
jgi:cation:H+ antiporter